MKAIIVAVNPQGVIGKDGNMPWHYPADLQRFKRLTMGGVVIMGRVTWESLPVKPLPGRLNLVGTSRPDDLELPDGVLACPGLKAALAAAEARAPGKDIWIIGGARLYKEALAHADLIDMTHVPDVVEGEGLVFFPELPEEDWVFGETETDPREPRLRRRVIRRRR